MDPDLAPHLSPDWAPQVALGFGSQLGCGFGPGLGQSVQAPTNAHQNVAATKNKTYAEAEIMRGAKNALEPIWLAAPIPGAKILRGAN